MNPAPTSWDVTFDPAKMEPYKGKITAYDGSIYIADAALYLKTHQPDLGITDPYELTQPQFDAAINLLKTQHGYRRQVLGGATPTRSTTSRAARRSSARRGRTRPTP